MNTLTVFCMLMIFCASNATFERNYYEDELKFKNPCLPSKMGLWGEEGVPERGWSEVFENCKTKGVLRTTWGTILAENLTFYLTENSRLVYLVGNESVYVPAVKAKNYTKADALTYSKGIYQAMYSYLIERGLSAGTMVSLNKNCINTVDEIKGITWNMMQGTHYRFPWVRVINQSSGVCVVEP